MHIVCAQQVQECRARKRRRTGEGGGRENEAYRRRVRRREEASLEPTKDWQELPQRRLHGAADIARFGNVRTFVAYEHIEHAVRGR